MEFIDLRSDTVTRPTPGMLQAMMSAEVGDDTLGDDPTVSCLEAYMAELLGKEAALFVPSGTMGNQICLRIHARSGEEVIAEAQSHILNWEAGAAAGLSGIQILPVAAQRGLLTVDQIQSAIRDRENVHYAPTALVCLENTHNFAGGVVYPLDLVAHIAHFVHSQGIPFHMDGARLFNAAVAAGVSARDYSQYFESVSVCLSKGLGAPMGSVIAGSRDFIRQGRRYRKMFGGSLRQAGFMAAAGLWALQHQIERLAEDHQRAYALALGLAELPGIYLDLETVQTNIVIFDTSGTGIPSAVLAEQLKAEGVLVSSFGPYRARLVTHLHITDQDVATTLSRVRHVITTLVGTTLPVR
ncbi:low-specificity L-threonine aldolase [Anthocerotibacter panamensis]|uniref:low-specificity L-threonine aldolase n=1 Tax=Anthocerotibacter panamensis TaxID=2857077 RepID=UPI001C403F4B|nr:low-specificity L-threonine aldolase [Anthocerotibacter panamensis]